MFTPNKDAILAHLTFLFGNETQGLIEIAYTASDSKAVNKSEYFNVTDLAGATDYAYKKNSADGVNVYVGAALRSQYSPPIGRSSLEDFYKSTVIWCDLDDANAAKEAKDKYKDLAPSFVVVTGRHPDLRAQVWWKLETPIEDPKMLDAHLERVCAALGGDKSVVDPIRVMRLGGTVAWPKKDGRIPEATEITRPKNASQSVSIEAFQSYFPAASPVDKQLAVGGVDLRPQRKTFVHSLKLTGWTIEDVRDHLAHINPDCAYDEWIAVGMALHAEGYGFNIWDEWSQRGIKYDAGVMRSHWKSFKGKGIGYGSIVHMAKKGGWNPSRSRVEPFHPSKINTPIEEEFDPETGEILTKAQQEGNKIEIGGAQDNAGNHKLFYINAPDISFSTDIIDFVKDTLTDGGLSVVYGESNCGKTFFMADLSAHIVLGKSWNGKRVKQGNVLYVSMEGSHGLKNRIAAYKMHHNTNLSGFLMVPCAVDFINPEGNIGEFIELLQDASAKIGNIRLVVIDTLARAIGGGDENSGQDMGILVKHADLIRSHTGAHICFIHHSGKDKARGARGHSSLRAAVDTEIEISRPEGQDYSNVKIAKQRDIEIAPDSQFKLKRVVLGLNNDGEEITSCVVEAYSAQDDIDRIELKIKDGKTKLAYAALIEAIDKHGVIRQSKDLPNVKTITENDFKEELKNRGLLSDNENSARAQYSRCRIDLIENELAVFRDGFLWAVRFV